MLRIRYPQEWSREHGVSQTYYVDKPWQLVQDRCIRAGSTWPPCHAAGLSKDPCVFGSHLVLSLADGLAFPKGCCRHSAAPTKQAFAAAAGWT
jgi:hypothetical protein